MKKLYFTILSAMLGLAVNAQTLAITNHSLVIGDIFKTRQCDSTGISPGGTGSAQTWNFAALNTRTASASMNYTVVTVASTGSATSYPSAGLATSPGANNNSFYSYNGNDYNYYGGNLTIGPVALTFTYTLLHF